MRVTVLYGGPSAEREVSLVSGRAVIDGLKSMGHEVFGSDVSPMDLSGLDRPTDPGVHALDRIRCAHDLADLGVEAQERYELRPGVLPQPHDRWVAGAPGLGELQEPFHRRRLGRRGVDRAQRLGDRVVVLAAGVAEAVAQ